MLITANYAKYGGIRQTKHLPGRAGEHIIMSEMAGRLSSPGTSGVLEGEAGMKVPWSANSGDEFYVH